MLKSRLIAEHRHDRNGRRRPSFRSLEACEVGCSIDLHSEDTLAILPHQRIGNSTTRGVAFLRSQDKDRREDQDSPDEIRPSPRILDVDGFSHRLALATGVAFGHRTQKNSSVVIAFSEPLEMAAAKETLRFALDHCLPIVYVQVDGPRPKKDRPAARAQGANQIQSIPVDQSDVVAVYRVAYEAIDKARRGAGPTVIRCLPCVSPSAQTAGKNSPGPDPIEYMEQYLRKKQLWSDGFKKSIEEDVSRELHQVMAARKPRRSE